MNIEKAIDILKRLRIATATTKVDGLRVLEPLSMAITALEKQVGKKCETDEDNNFYNCPCCNEDLMGCYGENDETAKCCLWCGQALKWEDSDD